MANSDVADRVLREPHLLDRFENEDHATVNVIEQGGKFRSSGIGERLSKYHSNHGWNYAQLLFVALVDALCQASEPTDINRQKRLFRKITKTLIQSGITPASCFSRELHGLRERARLGFVHLVAHAQKAMQVEDTMARRRIDSSSNPTWHGSVVAPVLRPVKLPINLSHHHPAISSVLMGRYNLDFEELEQLGKGGFGAVFKVRSYLDSQFYAMKKITLDLGNVDMCFRALREVKSLAMLCHPNIVRYYSSWLEFSNSPLRDDADHAAGSNSHRLRVQEMSSESVTNGYLVPLKLRHCLSSPDVTMGIPSDSSLAETGLEMSLPAIVEEGVYDKGITAGNSSVHGGRLIGSGMLVLYLQMELCTSTLRTWLNHRNSALTSLANAGDFDRFAWVDKEANKRILRQLLEALAYIHSRGIIHRDLKPSNIFLRTEPDDVSTPRVLLGDFGLCCQEKGQLRVAVADKDDGDACADSVDLVPTGSGGGEYRHSTGMGTLAYSAPEQLKSRFYDCMADMFSFGIVALEMYFPFITYMERIHNIMRVRQNDLDETFQRRLPLQAAIIRQLVQRKASLRPTARQLLEEETVFVDDSTCITALKRKLKEAEEELARLRHHNQQV